MTSPELGIALVSLMTFLGLVDWLSKASWRRSRPKAAIILFCTSAQIVTAFLSLYVHSLGLLAFTVCLLLAYLWFGFVGAERYKKEL